jgi:glycolate oxidase FAD binding subunit
MKVETPASTAQLVELLRDCQSAQRSIEIAGARSKQRMGGPIADCEIRIDTRKLNRILAYDPRDLTISVEAGITYRELLDTVSKKGQFLPIEPPFASTATIGGILATHSSGHRRRLFGTVRDLVIGMNFATLSGRVVQSGGMVVKNVAGLDFAKLMTGSFGTLACITVVNFKLMPAPADARTFLFQHSQLDEVFTRRNQLLKSVLQPASVDYLNPAAASQIGLPARHTLMVEALGSAKVLDRYQRELNTWQTTDNTMWAQVREFTPAWLGAHPGGQVLRISTTLQGMIDAIRRQPMESPIIGRAGNGVLYVHCSENATLPAGAKGVVEFSPAQRPPAETLWPSPGKDFPLMMKIKQYFDPDGLLNKGRLYGRI